MKAILISNKEVKYPEKTIYWIASDKKAVHYGTLEPNQVVTSARNIVLFEDEVGWEKALIALGINTYRRGHIAEVGFLQEIQNVQIEQGAKRRLSKRMIEQAKRFNTFNIIVMVLKMFKMFKMFKMSKQRSRCSNCSK